MGSIVHTFWHLKHRLPPWCLDHDPPSKDSVIDPDLDARVQVRPLPLQLVVSMDTDPESAWNSAN